MGVVLDNVAADPGEEPMVTTQLRGVTNVRLHPDAIKELTAIARQGGEVYGKYLCMHSINNGTLRHVVAMTTTDRTMAIGFVHTYHCNSRFAEMEIFPQYSNDRARGTTTAFFGAAAGFVEQGEFVHARAADKAVLHAATGFVRATEQMNGNENTAVPLGNLMATAESNKTLPRESLGGLGATVIEAPAGDKDAEGTVTTEPGTTAHLLLNGVRSNRKRKNMQAEAELDQLGYHKMMRLNAGQTEKINPDESTGIFPKSIPAANVTAYQERLRRDLAKGTVSTPEEYHRDLVAAPEPEAAAAAAAEPAAGDK